MNDMDRWNQFLTRRSLNYIVRCVSLYECVKIKKNMSLYESSCLIEGEARAT